MALDSMGISSLDVLQELEVCPTQHSGNILTNPSPQRLEPIHCLVLNSCAPSQPKIILLQKNNKYVKRMIWRATVCIFGVFAISK